MKTGIEIMPRSVLALAGLAAAIGCVMASTTTPGRAATWGDAKWCAVVNQGAGDFMWECVYDSVEECQPFILAGNRGWCSINPYWEPPPARQR